MYQKPVGDSPTPELHAVFRQHLQHLENQISSVTAQIHEHRQEVQSRLHKLENKLESGLLALAHMTSPLADPGMQTSDHQPHKDDSGSSTSFLDMTSRKSSTESAMVSEHHHQVEITWQLRRNARFMQPTVFTTNFVTTKVDHHIGHAPAAPRLASTEPVSFADHKSPYAEAHVCSRLPHGASCTDPEDIHCEKAAGGLTLDSCSKQHCQTISAPLLQAQEQQPFNDKLPDVQTHGNPQHAIMSSQHAIQIPDPGTRNIFSRGSANECPQPTVHSSSSLQQTAPQILGCRSEVI